MQARTKTQRCNKAACKKTENLVFYRYRIFLGGMDMSRHNELAKQNFINGMNCAQSVFCAFGDVHGFDADTAYRISSSFGGGIGRLREVCGALSGALMVMGMLEGGYPAGDGLAKAAHYKKIQSFAKAYGEEIGSIKCWKILGLDEGPSEPVPEAHTPEYLASRPCVRCVEAAAQLLDEFLEAREA